MSEGSIYVQTTISPEGFARCLGKMGVVNSNSKPEEIDLEKALAHAGVPEVVIKVMASENFNVSRIPPSVEEWAKEYTGGGTPSLWISGGSGVGKSTAAAWAVKEIIQLAESPQSLADGCKFVTVSDLVHGTWMGSGFYGEGNKWRLIEPLATCPLLVLDDLGSCIRHGKEECAVVRELVDKRWAHMLPTVYTTQYGLGEYCGSLEAAGANKHDTTSMANRILASLSNYVGRDDGLIQQHFVPMRWGE